MTHTHHSMGNDVEEIEQPIMQLGGKHFGGNFETLLFQNQGYFGIDRFVFILINGIVVFRNLLEVTDLI
jgi:hypothetical protein